MYNLLIGGEAGQGIDTTAAILEKLLKRAGYNVFTLRDFMSRIRGGHNFSVIRFGQDAVISHSNKLDGIIALDAETIEIHKNCLNPNGFILCDNKITSNDERVVKIDMDAMAKNIGNLRVKGSIAIGAALKLFGVSIVSAKEVIQSFLDERYIDINLKALNEGYDIANILFPTQKTDGSNKDSILISGSSALALGAMTAGLRFYAAYPMSPSTPIMVFLASYADETGIVVEQAEDEIAAINMALGASFAGARAMTGTSGGGFSLMVEALGLAGIAEIPVVIVDAQRPGPATGLPTRTEQGDLKFVISAAQGEFPRLVIAPKSHRDCFYQAIRALDLAEKYQIPVIILIDQYLGDSSSTIRPFDLSSIKVSQPSKKSEGEYLRYKLTEDGISPRLIPGMTKSLVCSDSDEHDERGWITESAEVRTKMVDKRLKKLEKLEKELSEPEFLGDEDYETLIIGWGSTFGAISEAVKLLNEGKNGRFGALVFGDVFPLPKKTLMEKAKIAKKIINVEQNATGQLSGLIREYTGITCHGSILKYDGRQISAEEIASRILKEVSK